MVKKKIIIAILVVVSFFLLNLAVGCSFIKGHIDEKISFTDKALLKNDKEIEKFNPTTKAEIKKDEIFNMLVCGVDKSNKLTDVIMLISYNKSKSTVSLLQIPRDTFVGNEYKTSKINSVYGSKKDHEQGMLTLKKLIEEMLFVKIENTAVINIDAFKKIVDNIGGVWFDVPLFLNYLPGKVIYPGEQNINGTQAEWIVRYRKGYATGDIGRLSMQKQFLQALIEKVKTLNLSQFLSVANIMYSDVQTDIEFNQILQLAPTALSINSKSINIYTLEGVGKMAGNQAVYELDLDKATNILNDYFRSSNENIPKENLKIKQVSNTAKIEYNTIKDDNKNDILKDNSSHNPWADFSI